MGTILMIKLIVGAVLLSVVVTAVTNVWRFSLSMMDRSQRKHRKPL
jgi:uncharacterized protein (DUF2062 family)